MPLTTTTLAGAITAEANSMVVASATGFVAGQWAKIDQEIVKIGKAYISGTTIPLSGRGQSGTVAEAHATSANVITGSAADFTSTPGPQKDVSYPLAGRTRSVNSYSAAGAIGLPTPGTDAVAVINGTGALAMTLADPTKDMDGCILTIIGNGKAAHTVTFATALGNNGTAANADVITLFATAQQGVQLMACGGFWCSLSAVAGAATLAGPGIG